MLGDNITDRLMTYRTEYVFAMTHPLMPGLVKIGMTTTPPMQYVLELSSSNVVPGSYELLCAVETSDAPNIEADLHQLFAATRVVDREFFEVDVEVVRSAFRLVTCQATPCRDNPVAQRQRDTPVLEPVDSLKADGIRQSPGGSVALPDANAEYVRWRESGEDGDD